jgi:hypothetical protein
VPGLARHNPFRVERVLSIVRYQPSGYGRDVFWPAIMRRLEELGCRAAVVGPEGSGKTTLLEDLRAALERHGRSVTMIGLARERPTLTGAQRSLALRCAESGGVLMLDGADLLGPLGWRRLRRQVGQTGGLVVTSHRRPLLPVLLRTGTTPDLLRRVVDQLLGDRSWPLPMSPEVLWNRHRGDLRRCLRELYDHWADSPA